MTGHVMHRRLAPMTHGFRYGLVMYRLDLDELDRLDDRLRLFGVDRARPVSFRRADHLANVMAVLAAHGVGVAIDRVELVTNCRVFGYVFNPVSFFLDYDARGALTSVIAEVNNTYGGRFRYVLGPAQRIAQPGERVGFRHVRELFVSPFLHGPATYDFWFDAALDAGTLAIEMHVHHDDQRLLTARMTGARALLSDRTLLAAALRYPLMSAQVIGLIHYEAVKLRLAGAPYRRPARDHRPLARSR